MVEVQEATATAGGAEPSRPPRPRWHAIAAGAAVFVVLVAAFFFVAGADDRALRDSLVQRRFVVSSITEDGQPKVLVGPGLSGEPAIGLIRFGNDYVSASGGCNSIGRGFDVGDSRLNVSREGSMTTAACSQEVMDQDSWLDGVVLAEPTIALDGERLTLTTASITIELVERAEPPSPPPPAAPSPLDPSLLSGRTFLATGALVNGVERRIVGPAGEPEPHRLRLTFGDGTASVTAGCNSGSGPYTVEMGRIEGLAITTERACPLELTDQDTWLNTLFATPPSIGLDGDYLTLGNNIDTLMILVDEAASAPSVAPSSFVDTRWNLDPSSTPGLSASSPGPFEAYLIVTGGEHPSVYLRDGCNVVTGTTEVDAASATSGTLAIGDLERTDASCPPALDPLVETMTAIQSGTWTYAIDIDRLELRQGDRTVVLRTS